MRLTPLNAARRGLLAVAATALAGALGCERPGAASPPPPIITLNVLTPHSADIQSTFAAAFSASYFKAFKRPVHVHYIYMGTPQCVEYADNSAAMRASGAPGSIPDVFFGGGIADHAYLAARGKTRELRFRDDRPNDIATVQGFPLRDVEGRWYATGLSTFGILVNEQAAKLRDIAPPRTWADLADVRFHGWIAIADPAASGSHRESLVIAMTHLGWEPGWATFIRILANARALEARSGDALRLVQSGSALATVAVNFDGQSAAERSGGALRYFDPPGATAATPDVISVLHTARDPALAEAFLSFALSDEGQKLWGLQRDARSGGLGETLHHYPVREEIYAEYAQSLAVDQNPFTHDFGVRLDAESSGRLGRIITAAAEALCDGDRHIRLQLAWRDLVERGLPAAEVAAFTAPLVAESDAAALDAALGNREAAARAAAIAKLVELVEARLRSAGK